MMLVMCAVLDAAVGSYSAPFFARSRGEAIRSFEIACGDKSLPFNKHPADFRLFVLGDFDDNSGVCTACSPALLANALDFAIPSS